MIDAQTDIRNENALESIQDQREPTMLDIIASAVRDVSVDPAKMSAVLDVMERLEAKKAEIAFNQALSRIAGKLPRVKKNGEVGYAEDKNNKNGPIKKAFNFARYEDIDAVIRPLLTEEGFSLSFTTEPRMGDGGGLVMHGTLSHVMGHHKTASIPLALDNSGGKNNIQGMGSTSSYGKRYTTCMLLNIVTEGQDDDGKKSEVISNEQAVEVDLLMREVGADKEKFLRFMKAPSVPEINARDYKKAIDMLKAKKAKAAK